MYLNKKLIFNVHNISSTTIFISLLKFPRPPPRGI